MSEKIGPFIVPTAEGGLALIHDYQRVPLDHQTCEHFWWTFSQYMKRWSEEQRKKNG